jgi:FtsZ-binding cell division protein ZapB|tara:strand:+ start:68 stop:238 length:171 start_codon:yes stop_codon:yes gene_type:complete
MSNENMLRAALATKQLEIDKLKRKIKEMEDDNQTRQRDNSDRKKNKRSKPSDISDQ